MQECTGSACHFRSAGTQQWFSKCLILRLLGPSIVHGVQIFPGGWFLCKPGDKSPHCPKTPHGRRLLRSSSEHNTGNLMGVATQENAYMFPVESLAGAPLSGMGATAQCWQTSGVPQ